MSISKIQEKVLSQKGCATVIAIGTCFIMSLFLFQSCARFGGGANQSQAPGAENAIATVGSTPITAEQATSALNQMISQQGMMGGAPPPAPTFASTAQMAPGSLSQVLGRAAFQVLADQNHISLNDDAILKAAKSTLEEMQPPSAKPDPKRESQIATALGNVKTALADPSKKQALLSDLAPQIVQQGMVDTYPLTPDQIKKTFDNYEIKEIDIASKPGVDAKAKADEAAKAIKGGLNFEAAMEKYSSAPPQKGKSISDSKMDLPESELAMFPTYKALDGKPAGFVSDPISNGGGGYSIFKVVSVVNKAPKDFATDPNKYKKQVAQMAVETKIRDQIKAILDSSAVKWNSKGYKALYDFGKLQETPDPKGPAVGMQKIIDEAKAAVQGNEDKTAALYAWFNAESTLYNAPGADKTKMAADRIDLLKTVLQNSEDYALRMELADLYIQQKNGTEALADLIQASNANTIYDVTGQDHYRDIAAKAMQLTALKLVPEDQLKDLNTAQDAWKKGKADNDKMQAEMKAEEEKQKAQAAEDAKKNAALLKQQKEQASKTGGATTDSKGVVTVPPKIQVNPPAAATATAGH